MAKGFLHLHVTAVSLFLILYTIKTVLLLMNRNAQLDKLRAKTKIADMVLGSVMLITGGYLLTIFPVQPYHYVKIIVALASIPVGIIAFKKGNKVLASVLLIAFIYVYGVAETKSLTFSKPKIEIPADTTAKTDSAVVDIIGQNADVALKNGKAIYDVACVACHGADGKLGVGGAKDLTQSTLSHEGKVDMITNGKGLMTPFKGQLSEQEIDAVARYVDSIKQ